MKKPFESQSAPYQPFIHLTRTHVHIRVTEATHSKVSTCDIVCWSKSGTLSCHVAFQINQTSQTTRENWNPKREQLISITKSAKGPESVLLLLAYSWI